MERRLERGNRFGSVTPKGVWELQEWETLLIRRCERSILGW